MGMAMLAATASARETPAKYSSHSESFKPLRSETKNTVRPEIKSTADTATGMRHWFREILPVTARSSAAILSPLMSPVTRGGFPNTRRARDFRIPAVS